MDTRITIVVEKIAPNGKIGKSERTFYIPYSVSDLIDYNQIGDVTRQLDTQAFGELVKPTPIATEEPEDDDPF